MQRSTKEHQLKGGEVGTNNTEFNSPLPKNFFSKAEVTFLVYKSMFGDSYCII